MCVPMNNKWEYYYCSAWLGIQSSVPTTTLLGTEQCLQRIKPYRMAGWLRGVPWNSFCEKEGVSLGRGTEVKRWSRHYSRIEAKWNCG